MKSLVQFYLKLHKPGKECNAGCAAGLGEENIWPILRATETNWRLWRCLSEDLSEEQVDYCLEIAAGNRSLIEAVVHDQDLSVKQLDSVIGAANGDWRWLEEIISLWKFSKQQLDRLVAEAEDKDKVELLKSLAPIRESQLSGQQIDLLIHLKKDDPYYLGTLANNQKLTPEQISLIMETRATDEVVLGSLLRSQKLTPKQIERLLENSPSEAVSMGILIHQADNLSAEQISCLEPVARRQGVLSAYLSAGAGVLSPDKVDRVISLADTETLRVLGESSRDLSERQINHILDNVGSNWQILRNLGERSKLTRGQIDRIIELAKGEPGSLIGCQELSESQIDRILDLSGDDLLNWYHITALQRVSERQVERFLNLKKPIAEILANLTCRQTLLPRQTERIVKLESLNPIPVDKLETERIVKLESLNPISVDKLELIDTRFYVLRESSGDFSDSLKNIYSVWSAWQGLIFKQKLPEQQMSQAIEAARRIEMFLTRLHKSRFLSEDERRNLRAYIGQIGYTLQKPDGRALEDYGPISDNHPISYIYGEGKNKMTVRKPALKSNLDSNKLSPAAVDYLLAVYEEGGSAPHRLIFSAEFSKEQLERLLNLICQKGDGWALNRLISRHELSIEQLASVQETGQRRGQSSDSLGWQILRNADRLKKFSIPQIEYIGDVMSREEKQKACLIEAGVISEFI